MRAAPPVQYPVGLFLGGRRVVWGLSGLAVLSVPVLLWGSAHWALSLAVSSMLAPGLAWFLWRYQSTQCKISGQLIWDDGCWSYLDGERAWPIQHLTVLWNMGDRIWLRWSAFVPGAKLVWSDAWVLDSDAPESWHLLRCALAAHSGKNCTQPSHLA